MSPARASARRLLGAVGQQMRDIERRPLLLSGLAAALALGVSVLMAWFAGIPETRAVLERTKPEWLALILAGMAVSYAGFAEAYGGTLSSAMEPRLPPRVILKLVAFGAAASSLFGGYSVDRRALRAAGASRADAGVRVMTMSALEYAVLALAAWVSALALLDDGHVEKGVSIPWAIGVPAGCIAAALAVRSLRSPGAAAEGLLRRTVGTTLDALALLAEQVLHPLRHRGAWLGMLLHWSGDLTAMWAALHAVGLDPSLPVLILGYATGYALSPRSLPLAGVGVTEALMPLSLSWVGLPLPAAVVAVFLYRGGRLIVSVPPALLAKPEVQGLLRRARS